MALFEQAKEFEIRGGQFTGIGNVIGNVYLGHSTTNEPDTEIRKIIEKDAALNGYSSSNETLRIPRFSRSLLLSELPPDSSNSGTNMGSCGFDLMYRLGLLPGQENESSAEYDTDIPLRAAITRGTCCCCRISRHGLVFLISRYFQSATLQEIPIRMQDGTVQLNCIIISTSIGRFKFYDIDDRTFVHFDGSTRSSYIDLIPNQKLDEILLAASGQYPQMNQVTWKKNVVIDADVISEYFDVPDAVMFMTKDTIQSWMRIKQFSSSLLNAVVAVIEDLKEPEDFKAIFNSLPRDDFGQPVQKLIDSGTTVEKLATCSFLYRVFSEKAVAKAEFMYIEAFAYLNMKTLLDAHKLYRRSDRVEVIKLLTRSQERFLDIFHKLNKLKPDHASVRHAPGAFLRQELRDILESNKDNIALVAFQGYLSVMALWNSSRILLNAREVPEEWIRFVGADDDDIFLG